MLRVVLDTNILVSGLIAKGKPRILLRSITNHKVQLIISNEILNEFMEVMKEEKFRKWVSNEQVRELPKL